MMPVSILNQSVDIQQMTKLQNFITSIRRFRNEHQIESAKEIEIISAPEVDQETKNIILTHEHVIRFLCRLSGMKFALIPDSWATFDAGSLLIGVNLAGTIDIAKERAKAEKEIAETENYLNATRGKLANQEFLSKAPPKVKEDMERKYAEAEEKLKALKDRLEKLG
jgi:valyl-tRNA synthetase